MTISADGRLAAGAGGDGLITIYDISNTKLSGTIGIRFSFGNYHTKPGVPVNKVKFRPNLTDTFEIAVATKGKGVMIINADEMKYKK